MLRNAISRGVALVAVGVCAATSSAQNGAIANSLRGGQVDFYDDTSLDAWNSSTTITNSSGNATAGLVPDPDDPLGRMVRGTTSEVNADRVLWENRLQFVPSGLPRTAPGVNNSNEMRVLVQYRWNWPNGLPTTNGRRQGIIRMIESGSGPGARETASVRLITRPGAATHGVQLAADTSQLTNSSNDATGNVDDLQDQWMTYLFEYRASGAVNGGGAADADGIIRLTMASGLHFSADDVRNNGRLIAESTSHTSTRTVGAFQLDDNPISHSTAFESYVRAFGWASDGDDPFIVDQIMVGQMRDASNDAVNVFAIAPGGAFKSDWHNDGAVRMAVRFWETGQPEPAAGTSETPRVTLTAANLWSGHVRVTGITPGNTAYQFRVIIYDETDDLDFVEAGHTLDYIPPLVMEPGTLKWMVGHCLQSTGAAGPYEFFQNAMNNGARHALLLDDTGYVDGSEDAAPTVGFSGFARSYYEMLHDQYMALFGRQGCIIARHGDHQWRNEWDINRRTTEAAIWSDGLAAWNHFFQDAMEGTLDPNYQDPLLNTHLARAYDWGPYRMTFFDDVTQYNFPTHDSLLDRTAGGTDQIQDLEASWFGTERPIVCLFTSRVGGPGDLSNPTFWNFNASYRQEFNDLMQNLDDNAPFSVVLHFSGDAHIAEVNVPNDPPYALFEATLGPLSSTRFNGAIPDDFASLPQPTRATRLFGITEGDTGNDWCRFYGLACFDGTDVTLEIRDGDRDDTLYYTSPGFQYNIPCLCDVNNDSLVMLDDFLLYLDDFFDELPGADINGDLLINIDDVLAFLECWFLLNINPASPCPVP